MNKTLCIDLRWIDCSGIGTYIKGIMPGLIAHMNDVTIIGIGSRNRIQKNIWSNEKNFKIIDCTAARYSLMEQISLPFAIPKMTDLFFSPHYPIPLLYRGQIVVTVHDMSHLVLPEIVNNKAKRLYATTMFREVRRRSEAIITNSEFTKSELLRLTKGSHEDNIIPIHLGVAKEWFEIKAALPKTSVPYIIHVGNIKPHKNLIRLVDAFTKIMNKIPHRLLIVGQYDGFITNEREDFFSRVKASHNRIEITGMVGQQELIAMVGNAQMLIMPSIYEGFGFPPLEAMAAGVATVVSNVGALPEICGNAALYCDPTSSDDIAEKIWNVLSDSVLRNDLIKRGKERVVQYSWDACSKKTAKIIRSML